jgi:hypothetical protein
MMIIGYIYVCTNIPLIRIVAEVKREEGISVLPEMTWTMTLAGADIVGEQV